MKINKFLTLPHRPPTHKDYWPQMGKWLLSTIKITKFKVIFAWVYAYFLGFPGGASGKELTCQCRRHKRCRFDPQFGKIPWGRALGPHSSILAWRIPRTEEPGRLQSIWSQRVRYNWSDLTHMLVFRFLNGKRAKCSFSLVWWPHCLASALDWSPPCDCQRTWNQ